MRRSPLAAILLFLPLACATAPRDPTRDAVARVLPGVIAVEVLGTDGSVYVGSGFAIARPGRFLTSRHTVEDAREVMVFWDSDLDRTPRRAKVIALDDRLDLALLETEGPPEGPFPPLPLASDDVPAPGQTVLVFGFADLAQPARGTPVRKRASVFRGIVSSLQEGGDGTPARFFLDATVLGGTSGGPVWDPVAGTVLGVATEVFVERGEDEGAPPVEWGKLAAAVPAGAVRRFLLSAEGAKP